VRAIALETCAHRESSRWATILRVSLRPNRKRRAVALLAIALVLCSIAIPAVTASVGTPVLVSLGVVVPPAFVTLVRREASRCDEQPIALLSVLDSRAPPSIG